METTLKISITENKSKINTQNRENAINELQKLIDKIKNIPNDNFHLIGIFNLIEITNS